MTYLIADSGSTKCDWMLIHENGQKQSFSTMGFNPFFHNAETVYDAIQANTELFSIAPAIDAVYLYSAGCSSEELKSIIAQGLKKAFPHAKVLVDHDLVGAAFATYTGEPAITCILGTGSNSCYFDGQNVSQELPALGYILGDEGSGSYFGKRLLVDFLYHRLPTNITDYVVNDLGLNKNDILERVYKQPHANVYLASFVPVFTKFKETNYTNTVISEGLELFLKNHVCAYANHKQVPVHFIGSIAYHFSACLQEVARRLEIRIGQIIQKPIDGLVNYHSKYVVGSM